MPQLSIILATLHRYLALVLDQFKVVDEVFRMRSQHQSPPCIRASSPHVFSCLWLPSLLESQWQACAIHNGCKHMPGMERFSTTLLQKVITRLHSDPRQRWSLCTARNKPTFSNYLSFQGFPDASSH